MRARPSDASRPDDDGDDAVGTRSSPPDDGDRDLYDRLSDEEFADHAFEVLAVALVGYAYRVLHSWLATGEIYRQAALRGRPVSPSDAERIYLYTHPDEIDEIVNEALGEALVYLRNCATSGEGKWDPAAGASLPTYFVGACVLRFPTVYRRWSRDLQRQPPTDSYSDDNRLIALLPSHVDLELQIVSEILAEEKLNTMPPNVRRIVELRTGGRSFADIAELTGATSARAIEGVLKRYRDGLRRRGHGGRR
jgi:hypothetical protein